MPVSLAQVKPSEAYRILAARLRYNPANVALLQILRDAAEDHHLDLIASVRKAESECSHYLFTQEVLCPMSHALALPSASLQP
jgi:hypothetical protein